MAGSTGRPAGDQTHRAIYRRRRKGRCLCRRPDTRRSGAVQQPAALHETSSCPDRRRPLRRVQRTALEKLYLPDPDEYHLCERLSAAGPNERARLTVTPAKERVKESRWSWTIAVRPFETAALRPPQDEGLSQCHQQHTSC